MDIPTDEVLTFVRRHLPDTRARVLEVGAGGGHLAAALGELGHSISTIDASPDAVAEARARGVDARHGRFPEDSIDTSVDAILFTRVLHHIPDLDGALERARYLMTTNGLLIVDEFAWEEVDRSTAAWAYGTMKLLAELSRVETWDDAGDAEDAWMRQHLAHPLHPAAMVIEAVARRFDVVETVKVPYFYRYLCRDLKDDPRGAAAAEAFRALEANLIATRAIRAIGVRLAARR